MSIDLIRGEKVWFEGVAPVAGRKSFVQIIMASTLSAILREVETEQKQ
jgi:hypothetical protein